MALAAAFARARAVNKQVAPSTPAHITIIPPNLEGLNDEQCAAFNELSHGKNVFLTGPGGTGKSYFLDR